MTTPATAAAIKSPIEWTLQEDQRERQHRGHFDGCQGQQKTRRHTPAIVNEHEHSHQAERDQDGELAQDMMRQRRIREPDDRGKQHGFERPEATAAFTPTPQSPQGERHECQTTGDVQDDPGRPEQVFRHQRQSSKQGKARRRVHHHIVRVWVLTADYGSAGDHTILEIDLVGVGPELDQRRGPQDDKGNGRSDRKHSSRKRPPRPEQGNDDDQGQCGTR